MVIEIYERAHELLFEGEHSLIEIPPFPNYDPALRNEFNIYIDNRADCRVLADCVECSRTNGTGTFVTRDSDDFFDDDEGTETSKDDADDDEILSASLDEFADDSRTLSEKINDKIRQYYDDTATLDIVRPETIASADS